MQFYQSIPFRILQIAAVSVFAGRAYQHIFWDAPYREILWDPVYTGWLVEHFTSLSWETYVTHPKGDLMIQGLIRGQGVFYVFCAIVAALIHRLPKWCRWLLMLGAFNLMVLALIYMKDKFYHFGQFFEYSLQFATPVFLYIALRSQTITDSLIRWMKIAIALTFACHGLYAIGYYPRPESFMTMTQSILGLDATATKWYLNTAGVLDYVVAFGIFLPYRKLVLASLLYASFWGLLTTLARIIGNFYWDFPLESLHQWVFEAVFRFPHFLIPLAVWVLIKQGGVVGNKPGTTAAR